MSALPALLFGLVDYAGLFPPAALDMDAAVAAYARHRECEEAFMLGRFVVPVKRLEAWASAARDVGGGEWVLSVLVSGPEEYEVLRLFRQGNGDLALVDTIEVKAASEDEVGRLFGGLPAGLTVYVEVPVDASETLLREVQRHGGRVKVRTGGVTAEAFPSSAALARFIAACCRVGVPFKATAGLHHPLRAVRPLAQGSVAMHGFLNVFLTAALLRGGGTVEEAERLLDETSWDAFAFTDTEIRWRDRRFDADALAAARNSFAMSFGSCSFDEPIDDLKERHLL